MKSHQKKSDKSDTGCKIKSDKSDTGRKIKSDKSDTGRKIKSDSDYHSPSEKSPHSDPTDTRYHKKLEKMNELQKLYHYMKQFQIKKRDDKLAVTHYLMDEPYGTFNIPDKDYDKFLHYYEDAVIHGYRPSVVERHREFGPIVIDFDFVYKGDVKDRSYTKRHIKKIIKMYNSIILKYLSVEEKNLVSYVLEKEKPVLRKGKYHDGIHIVYPYICTKPSLQFLMRDQFLKGAERDGIFEDIPLENRLDAVHDKSVIYHSGWLMYKSRKDKYSGVYDVTMIFQKSGDNIINLFLDEDRDNVGDIHEYIRMLSCRQYYNEDQLTPLKEEVEIKNLDYKINDVKKKLNFQNEAEIQSYMGKECNFTKVTDEEVYMEAKNLTKLFSEGRAAEYFTWYQIGKCLHNIDHRLLSDWIEFSKKCPEKFKEGECGKLWNKMKPSGYTMATLHYFAKMDNPELYLKLKEMKLDTLIKNGLEGSHTAIANLLMEKYRFNFVCASIKDNTWYEFKNHRWVEIDSAFSLRNLLSSELVNDYIKEQSQYYTLATQTTGYEKEQNLNKATYISKLIQKLNNGNFKSGVIKECAFLAYSPSFLQKLNNNLHLICFENGVYDLEADIFRDGCPDDYISLCTNYPYIPYNSEDIHSKDVMDFIKKIQPDDVMREYMLTLFSTCLSGVIAEESFYILTGSGSNGKSKFIELVKYTLGDYYKPMDVRLITEKRSSSSSASPEVADKPGVRACTFDEPRATDEINTSFMKIFTGGDMVPARALFKAPIYFKPQFKPFLLCNILPNIKADDDGTWRRIKVIPFLSKFVKYSDLSKKMRDKGLGPGQFWADLSISEKLPEWKQAFLGILLEYYRIYKKNGLKHPKLVTQYTKQYRKRCDIYQDFIGDFLEKTDNEKDGITTFNLHEGMNTWYRSNYNRDGKCPNTKDLRNYLQKRMETYDSKTDTLKFYRVKKLGLEMDDAANIEGL